MPVQKIGREEFAHLYPDVQGLTPFIGDAEEVEWFTDDARDALGLIFRSTAQPVWRYAVLKRSRRGDFRVSHLGAEFADLPTTRDRCRLAITAAEYQPAAGGDETQAPQPQPQQHLEEKHRGSLVVVLLILVGDLITIGVLLLMLRHWFR